MHLYKVQEYRYAVIYNNEPDFKIHIRMLVALGYVLNYNKVCVYEEIIELASFPQVNPFLNYFEYTFLGIQRNGERQLLGFQPKSGMATKLLVTTNFLQKHSRRLA
jgi:hypothetical protein